MTFNMGSFRKGQSPWNKGIKGTHFSPETEFKKGQKSINHLPVGSITIRKYYKRNLSPKRWIKIAEPNKWIMYTVYLWQKNIGNIPADKILHHINRDSLDDRIENLCLVTRAEHINIHRADLEKNRVCRRKYNIPIEHLRAVVNGRMTHSGLAAIIGCSVGNIYHHIRMLRKKWKQGIVI